MEQHVGKIEFGPCGPYRTRSMADNMLVEPEPTGQCKYCYGTHSPEMCSNVKAIEYYPTGGIKRVELVR